MTTEITCLVCRGQHIKEKHVCSTGDLCVAEEEKHFDWCQRCMRLMWKSVCKEFQESPTSKAREQLKNNPRMTN